ncbi:MAG: CPBP family intramembrane metalloprotease [Minicystis sp.]
MWIPHLAQIEAEARLEIRPRPRVERPAPAAQSMKRSLSILLSAVAFALAHYSLHMAPLAFTLFLLVSLSLSYVRIRYGIRAAIGLHLGNNLLAFCSTVLGWNALNRVLEDPMLSRTALVISAVGLILVLNDLRKIVDRKPYSLP